MEIRHAAILDGEVQETMQTIQIMRSTCPYCHKAVDFAVAEDDRQFEKDAAFFESEAKRLGAEIVRLNRIIDLIVHGKLRP